jgi:hypothetical protein
LQLILVLNTSSSEMKETTNAHHAQDPTEEELPELLTRSQRSRSIESLDQVHTSRFGQSDFPMLLNPLITVETDSLLPMVLMRVASSLTLTEVLDNGGQPNSVELTALSKSESETEEIAAVEDLLEPEY